MATATYPPSDYTGVLGDTNLDALIPELWSDQIIAPYKANLVVGSLCTVFEHNGRKGDVIHIPNLTRANATAKAEATAVTITGNIETTTDITINRHFHVARMHEDFAAIQATDVMTWMTDDAGLALATQVDTDLHTLGTSLQGGTLDQTAPIAYDAAVIGGDGTTAWDATASTNTGNGSTLTDAGIREMIQTLDDQNIPQTERFLIIPPVEKKTLLGLSRFTEQAFVGEVGAANSIRNGRVGDIYGVGVYVSTNCVSLQAADSSTNYRAGLLIHRSAFGLVMQQNVRVNECPSTARVVH